MDYPTSDGLGSDNFNLAQKLENLIDFRNLWLKKKILTFFNETDEELFDQMLARNDNKVAKQIVPFIEEDSDSLDRKLLIVFKTYYDKVINEEVIVPEEGDFLLL